jgi:hypothetical protein
VTTERIHKPTDIFNACEVSGYAAADHFVAANKLVELYSGTQSQIERIARTGDSLNCSNGDHALLDT